MNAIRSVMLAMVGVSLVGLSIYQSRQTTRWRSAFHELESNNTQEVIRLKSALASERQALSEAQQALEKAKSELASLPDIEARNLAEVSLVATAGQKPEIFEEDKADREQIEALKQHSHTIPKELWGYAGRDTPEDAFLTTVWSASQGNVQSYLDSLSQEAKQRFQVKFEGKSVSEIEESMRQMIEPLKAIRLDRIKRNSEHEASFTLHTEEVDDGQTRHRSEAVLSFEKKDGQWVSGGIF